MQPRPVKHRPQFLIDLDKSAPVNLDTERLRRRIVFTIFATFMWAALAGAAVYYLSKWFS